MTSKIRSMFSRFAAQCLKPVFAILAVLAVGGAWAAGWWSSGTEWSSVVWDGNSSEYFIAPRSDLSLSFNGACTAENNVRIGNNDYNNKNGHTITFSADSNSESDGLSITGSLNVGENGDQGILKITSGRYTASAGLYVSGGDSKYGSLIMDGGYLDVTGEVQFGNAENSICTNYINAGATIANNSYLCVGRAAGTDTYLEVNGGTVQTTGILTIGTCGSEASKGEMVVKGGTVTANYIKVGEFDTATLTISGGNVTGTTGLMLADAAPDNNRTWNTEGFTANEEATLNLDGGVLTTPSIVRGNGAGSGNTYVNFNGGTLAATAAGTLIGSDLTVTIGSNGGTIDVGANNVTIAATVTGTGTIIKKGSGTLAFTGGMSGFTGQIVVEEGCGTVSIPTASIGVIAAGTGTGSRVVGDNTIFLPSKFYWIGGSSGNWDDGSKWSLTEGGSAIGVYPANSGDKARFATTAGTVTLQTTAALTLNCDIDIPEGVTLDFVPNDKSLTCNGSFTGRGILSMRSNTSKKNTYAGMHLHGDNSEFAGTVKIYSDANQQRDTHDLNGLGSSSNATWRVYVDGAKNLSEGPFKTVGQTYYLGAAQVKFYNPNSGGFTGANCVFEVGALDIDSSFSAVDSNAKYGSMCKLRWIAPTATLTHDVGNLQILEICGGGTVEVGTTYSLPLRIKFSDKGGTLKTAADPSAVLTQSEVAICYDDGGDNRTWATALASSNVGGIVKKGTGTLTLSAAPAWTSAQPITVMDGKLVVNDSSFANYTLGEGTKVTTVDSTLVFAPDARATVTFADTETYSLSVSVNNSVIASGDKIDAGETLVISANAIAGYKVTSILVNGVVISGNEYSVATGDVEGGVVISAVAEAVVAKIGDKEYVSLEDALADAVSGDVIVLYGNVILDKNLTLVEGVTVNANGYAITRGEYGVHCPDGYHELSENGQPVYLRTAYVWNGGASGTWTDSVWLVNGESSSAPSQASDVVVVDTQAAIAMNSGRTGQLYLDADVTLTGTLTVDVIKGSGMVTFSGTTLNGGNGQQVYCDAYFTGTVNANTASLSLYGKFKGDAANISFTSSGSYNPGFSFYGDVSDFTGLYTGGRARINIRDITKIYSKEFNGAAGSWDFDRHENLNDGYAFQGGDNATYKFGWLKNEKFTLVTYHGSSGDTIAKNCEVEVGAVANKNSAINGTLSDDSNTFRKVGATSTCDLTLTESKGTVEIKEGLLNLADMLPNEIKFTGGTLKTALDPSACIASSTSAIVFDDWGETYEWASAISNSNNGGFTKKGSGTLTLSQPPAYTGTTTVEAGLLVMPASVETSLTLGANTIVSARDANTITLANATTVNITGLTHEHATATLTADGVPVSVSEDVAAVPVGSDVVITWAAASDYRIDADGRQDITDIREAVAATAPVVSYYPSVTVSGVTATYGADFATADVTVAMTGATEGQKYTMSVGGKDYSGTAASNGSVTFSDVATGHASAYDSFSYTITSDDASVSGGSGSKTIADEAAWFSTSASGTTGGSWNVSPWANENGGVVTSDNSFTPTAASSASVVDVTLQVCFGDANDDAIELTDAKAAVKIATVNDSPVFQALNDGVFVTLTSVEPDPAETYTVALRLDYANQCYSVKIDGTQMTYNESQWLAMPNDATAMTAVAFQGQGTLTSLVGTQSEGYVAMDAAGNRYESLDAAMIGVASDSSKLPLTVLHDGTLNNETYAKSSQVLPTGVNNVTINAADQAAADAAAANMQIVLTSDQVTQGLKKDYYKAVATKNGEGDTYTLSIELDETQVAPTVEADADHKAMEVTTSSVSLNVTKAKVGLYYGIAAGGTPETVAAGTMTKCQTDGEDLNLTAEMPESGVKYYKVIVSDVGNN